MIKKERLTEKIREMKFRIFAEQAGLCASCHLPMAITSFELAHKIPRRVWTTRLWGDEVINHRMNLCGTHSGRCNSSAQLNPDSIIAENHVLDIRRALRRERERRYAR